MTKITTFDTTLRDGAQQSGVALTLADKLHIVARLDAFGIDIIEGGFPASNPKDREFFEAVAGLDLKHARIAAFGATRKAGITASDDEGLCALVSCGAPVVALVGKAWDLQVTEVLQTTLPENIAMIKDSVAFCANAEVDNNGAQKARMVVFDAEHFFDGYAANPQYALECVVAAAASGAVNVTLCDTNGGALPTEVARATEAARAALDEAGFEKVALGIHCHNDAGLAVANTLSAVGAGATLVQGTVNGYGERVGNTDILTTIANLELKLGLETSSRDTLQDLTSVSHFVAETCNRGVPNHHPYVGKMAFAHKAGLHAAAEARMTEAYEHVDPARVGNSSRMLVSELAGKASLIAKAQTLGFDLNEHVQAIQPILDEIKQREAAGYTFEVADGSLAIIIMRHIGAYKPHFELESFRVIVDDYEDCGALAKDAMSEATIKIHVGDKRFVATGEGAGPVGALDVALRKALIEFYPALAGIELTDFKVRILDENVGTDAITRVAITTADAAGSWGTIGVSENIIEASWNALVDSVEYGLLRAGQDLQ